MSRSRGVAPRLIPVTAVLLAACGTSAIAGGATSPTVQSPSASSSSAALQVVDGLTIDTTSDRGSMSAIVTGVASIDRRGCWILTVPGDGATPIVWPLGTRWTDTRHTAVVVASGVVVRSGQSITAGGGTIDTVPRSQVSIASDVHCLGEDPVSFAVVNPDVRLSS